MGDLWPHKLFTLLLGSIGPQTPSGRNCCTISSLFYFMLFYVFLDYLGEGTTLTREEGDIVTVGQCRPLSKTVRFNVLKAPAASSGRALPSCI